MAHPLITEDLHHFLKAKEFLYLATSNSEGRPYVAPKFLIKTDDDFIYLADFVIGRTCENLKLCSKVSLAVMNLEDLVGYQMNGSAQILDHGGEFDKIIQDLDKRKMHFSVERILEGSRKSKTHRNFEVNFPERFVVIKVEIEEVVEIAASGKIEKKLRSKN